METYEDGRENASYYILPGIMLNIALIDYLKRMAIEHGMPHLVGIADGIWQIISQAEFDKEELICGINTPASTATPTTKINIGGIKA